MIASSLADSANDFDIDYFTPQLDSSKFFCPRLDELGTDGDRILPPASPKPEARTLLEPIVSLMSPTPISSSVDSFPVVVDVPSTSHPSIVSPTVAVSEDLVALPLTPTPLPAGAEDSLGFSFEAALGVGGGSSEVPSSGSTPSVLPLR